MASRRPPSSRNTPVPASSRPTSTAPAAASRETQDLAQKNRTLEHTLVRIREDLAHVKGEHAAERESLLRDVRTMLSFNRIFYLRTADMLEQERTKALRHSKELRSERAARIRCDFAITQFQMKETDLEVQIDRLQEQLEEQEKEAEEAREELEKNTAQIFAELDKTKGLLKDAEVARDEAQADALRARKEQSTANSNKSSLKADLDRANLKLENAQTQVKELQRKCDDVTREKTSLQSQIDGWENLEKQGSSDAEQLRRQNAELEDKVKDLQSRLDGAQKKAGKGGSAEVKELKKHAEELETTNAELYQELENLRSQSGDVTRSQKKIVKLSNALQDEHAQREMAEQRLEDLQAEFSALQLKFDEMSTAKTNPPPSNTQPRPRLKPQAAKPRAGSKQPRGAAAVSDHDSDIQEIEPLPPVNKGKGKAPPPVPIVIDGDSEPPSRPASVVDFISGSDEPGPSTKRRKRKPVDDEPQGKRRKKDKTAEAKEKEKGAAAKGASTRKASGSTAAAKKGKKAASKSSDEEDDELPAQKEKKKMRRINPFASTQPANNATSWFGEDDGIIPSVLSPIKPGTVPQRSANLRTSVAMGRR